MAERSTEVLAGHAYAGGYDLNEVYGKKKPSNTSAPAAGGYTHDNAGNSSSAHSYGGSPNSSSPYMKPAEDYSETRPAVSGAGYGHGSAYGGRRPDAYEDGAKRPGYGGNPIPHGEYDNDTESRPPYGRRPGLVEQEDDSESQWRPGHGSRPGYGEDVAEDGYYHAGQGRKPSGHGEDEELPFRRPSRPGYGEDVPEEGCYHAGQGRKPSHGEDEELPFRRPSRPGYGEDVSEEGYYHAGQGRNPSHGEDEEVPSRRPSRPVGYGTYGDPEEGAYKAGPPPHNSAYGDEDKYVWEADSGDSGYGEGRRPPHRRPENEYECARPAFGRQEEEPVEYESGYNRHGNPLGDESGHKKHEHPYVEDEERRNSHYYGEGGNESGPSGQTGYAWTGTGRRYEEDVLASETGGLSLGTDSYQGSADERYRPYRGDGYEEEDHHKKHGHHRKHDDDDY